MPKHRILSAAICAISAIPVLAAATPSHAATDIVRWASQSG
jgi:hypothetical protein